MPCASLTAGAATDHDDDLPAQLRLTHAGTPAGGR
jgi:hypothetical protein